MSGTRSNSRERLCAMESGTCAIDGKMAARIGGSVVVKESTRNEERFDQQGEERGSKHSFKHAATLTPIGNLD